MKRTLAVSIALYIALFLIPLLTAGQFPLLEGGREPSPPPQAEPEAGAPPVPADSSAAESPSPSPEPSASPEPPEPAVSPPADAGASISVLTDGSVREMTLRDFICGAVAAEMPALYPEEALKAQAVAIRTFALYALEHPYHRDAPLCGNWECCLAFSPLEERAADWGGQYEELAGRIRAAADQTDGVVIYYAGEPIEAVFFAATDGRTRSAAEVWGTDVPYLQSVGSAFDTDFPDGARGHGVGMSQYGARQLALAGLSYEDILQWYYTGVEVRQIPYEN
ncbi:MAG: SpoIID/LytB domain-containing protein [Oscillospiraceae bacterium]|nr:SpoIID/LytB domain-containing protein [Oscillospiraceae bacterium]